MSFQQAAGGVRAADSAALAPPHAAVAGTMVGQAAPQQWLIDWRERVNALQYHAPLTRPWRGLIPPNLFQLSYLPEQELALNGAFMRGWWVLNPDFHYHLLSEADCSDFVQRFVRPTNHLRMRR